MTRRRGTSPSTAWTFKDVAFKSLRGQTGLVTQEAILFNDSVRNNILYGTFDAPPERVEQASRMALAHGFVEKCPRVTTRWSVTGFSAVGRGETTPDHCPCYS